MLVKDAPAFVVNRLLIRTTAVITQAVDDGTPVEVADAALRPLGLPMPPFVLLQLVGPAVALHVTETLHAAFGDRFPVSTNLRALVAAQRPGIYDFTPEGKPYVSEETTALLTVGDSPSTAEELRGRVEEALAEEIGLMLRRGRGRRADGHRPVPHPGRRLAVPPGGHHPVPRSRGCLGAGRRSAVPAEGCGDSALRTSTPLSSRPSQPLPPLRLLTHWWDWAAPARPGWRTRSVKSCEATRPIRFLTVCGGSICPAVSDDPGVLAAFADAAGVPGGAAAGQATALRRMLDSGMPSWCSTTASTSPRLATARRRDRYCPGVVVLATSRISLVGSLVRHVAVESASEIAERTEAVRLFYDRAGVAAPGYAALAWMPPSSPLCASGWAVCPGDRAGRPVGAHPVRDRSISQLERSQSLLASQ